MKNILILLLAGALATPAAIHRPKFHRPTKRQWVVITTDAAQMAMGALSAARSRQATTAPVSITIYGPGTPTVGKPK